MSGTIRKLFAFALAAFVVLTLAAAPLSGVVSAQDGKNGIPLPSTSTSERLAAAEQVTIDPSAIDGAVTAYVVLDGEPTAVAFARAGADRARAAAASAVDRQLSVIENQQNNVESALRNIGVSVLARTRVSINSLMVSITPDQVAAIEALPGVQEVIIEPQMYPDNANSVPAIGVPTAWESGFRGQGLRIGIIDSGIDYGNRTFGTWDGTPWTGYNQGASGTKVVGGFDFAGDAYNGSNAPVPDNDPRDCTNDALAFGPGGTVGHGTHVAGTAAGYGITGAGTTYAGPWDTTTPFGTMIMGPGVAPEASLYALRVFGCTGSTGLTTLAIEWAIDPNNDGNPADRLDVINMSLGASNGTAVSASAIASDNAALAGVIVVASAGNNGDSYFVTGEPGASARAISVAASADGARALTVTAPGAAGTPYAAAPAAFGDAISTPITGTLEYTNPALACNPGITGFTPGNIALIDRGACAFAEKAQNADAAGAIGMIVCNNAPGTLTMGGSPVLTPPFFAVMISQADCNAIKALMGGPGTTYPNLVTVGPSPTGEPLASFSSRGPSRATGASGGIALKPDVAAPGVGIVSARINQPAGVQTLGGTSMAAPHVAGLMALMRQAFPAPAWSVADLKAMIMNTANVDTIFSSVNPTLMSPSIQGAGRANILNALGLSGGQATRRVLAYNSASPERVSVSFGMVEAVAPANTVLTRQITVDNRGSAPVTYNVSYVARVTGPATSVSVSPATINVPAGGTATVTVTLTVNPNVALPFIQDPTSSPTHPSPFGGTQSRHWLSEETGYVLLTSTPDTLRVPVYATTRPAGTMQAVPSQINLPDEQGVVDINLAGTQVFTGGTIGAPVAQDILGIVSAYDLLWISPNESDNGEDSLINHADLRFVGATSDFAANLALAGGDVATALANTTVFFGLATHGNWSTLREVTFNVFIDTNQDGVDDYQLRNIQMGAFLSPAQQLDGYWTFLTAPGSESGFLHAPVNGFYPSTAAPQFGYPVINTYLLNTNVLALPVYASGGPVNASLGLTPTSATFNFRVETFSREYGVVDVSPTLTYNVTEPVLEYTGGFDWLTAWPDLNGATIPVGYNMANYTGGPLNILLLHHHNSTTASRAEFVQVLAPGVPVGTPETGPGVAVAGTPVPVVLPATGYPPAPDSTGTTLALLALGLIVLGLGTVMLVARRRSR